MDHLTHAATASAASHAVSNQAVAHAQSSLLHSLSLEHLIPLLAVAVWCIEYRQRTRSSGDSDDGFGKRIFMQLMPEMIGLTILCGAVVVMMACHREDNSLQHDEAWKDVKKEWPLLMTADTLIGFQALLRLVMLFSASLRRSGARLSPLDGEPAAFFLLAASVRVALLALSPPDVYRLDGPLGGDMNVAAEVTAFLLLLPLGSNILYKGFLRIGAVFLVALILAASAKNNHFALADTSLSHLDVLFSLTMLLEIVAGVAFYFRSAKTKGGYVWDAFTGFAHLMLPLQQAFPAYFLLVAFAPPFKSEPSLVGTGRPFELLQSGALLQMVMYMGAALLYFMACAEERQVSLFAFPVKPDQAPEADECVICLGSCECCGHEDLKPMWRRLRCGHQFHEHCIFEWLKKSQRCPMCRRHLSEKGNFKWKHSPNETTGDAAPVNEADNATESMPLLAQEF